MIFFYYFYVRIFSSYIAVLYMQVYRVQTGYIVTCRLFPCRRRGTLLRHKRSLIFAAIIVRGTYVEPLSVLLAVIMRFTVNS